MTWLWLLLLVAGGVVSAALVYWQLIIAEGTYLGPRAVAWTYDLVARRYDAIKRFEPRDESWFVAGPVIRGLQGVKRPLLLDVATGTGRLPLALLRERFQGRIVGLDLSKGMLRQARAKLQAYDNQVCLVRHDARYLPFADSTFDAVTCLESLEFMAQPLSTLAEMVRVLAPGGVLFFTNRVGREARLLPGRAIPRPEFKQVLALLPLCDVEVCPWQVQYDLAMARKNGQRVLAGRGDIEWASLFRCPQCGARLRQEVASLSCTTCERTYSFQEGVVRLATF
jgi:ubiquinone/menaquinone biosynthesis C-methylase UbiE